METVVETNIDIIRDNIIACYTDCPRTTGLHNDYSGYTVSQCADDIIEKLAELDTYNFYLVHKDGDLVGYFGDTVTNNLDCLYTFFVRPKYRNSNDLTEFWDQIKNNFNGDFFAGIYSSNEPATKFLTRNGGKIVTFDNASYFIFKSSEIDVS